jgi:TRAP-type C4-dicarboxylate transport system permease small subunit
MNRRGQLSIINIIFFLILTFVMAVCSGVIDQFITTFAVQMNATGLTLTLMNLVVPFMWLGLVITFFLYVVPIRPQQY